MTIGNTLGIEGGGTRTTWVVLDACGTVRRQGEAGPGNILLLTDTALRALVRSIHAGAGSEIAAIGATFAGAQRSAEKDRVWRVLAKLWPQAKIIIAGDTHSALAAAHGTADGICVIAGTGSNVVAQHGAFLEKAGGWGHLFSDHGSAYDLARRGLEAVYAHYDATQKVTPLGHVFLRVAGQNSLEDLVGWAISHPEKMDIAALAPCVFEAAKAGDPLAKKVIQSGAAELAGRVGFLAKRHRWTAPRVGLVGGLFIHAPEYAALLKREIRRALPKSEIFVVNQSGALAAAALAGAKASEENPPVISAHPTPTARSIARSTTEQRNPRSRGLQRRSVQGLVDLFVAEEACVQRAAKAQRREIAQAAELISKALKKGGRLFYVGAGTSGRLGVVDASEMPPTFNAPPGQVQAIMAGGQAAVFRSQEGAEDDAAAGTKAVHQRGVCKGDVVCGIAASGQTPFVHGALREANRLGIATVLITCNPNRPPYNHIDVIIDLPTGPEIVTGSTRLKAGTATKVVLNMLSTIAMIRLGRVHDNLMIDVQATNAKLRLRAKRLVATIRGCTEEQAEELLKKNGWSVRKVVEFWRK